MATTKKPAQKSNRSTTAKRSGAGRGGDGTGTQVGEQYDGGDTGTALIEGGFGIKAVTYAVVEGRCIIEGDIDLGSVDEVADRTAQLRDELSGERVAAALITGDRFRWPGCRVPFEIEPGLPSPQRVRDAIAHWEANTRFRFVERTAANATTFPDFVRFVNGSGCSSAVGRRGGMQTLTLGPSCSVGNAIHEIGHAIGLWHEQSREDRDAFVTIQWANIQAGREHNFNQHITDGDDIGAYDYGSIMHYPRNAFSSNGNDTIVPTTAGVTIGQRTALSAGDIAAANSMCPPPKLVKEVVKDVIKDIRDDVTFKEAVKDTIKDIRKDIRDDLPTFKEAVRDTIKEASFDPTIKEGAFDPPFGRPWERHGGARGPMVGGVMPFGVTGAGGLGAASDAQQAEQAVAELDAELASIVAAIDGVDAARAMLAARFDELAAAREQIAGQA